MTRTICKGAPSNKLIKMYKAVKDAQKKAINSIKEGVYGSDIHKEIVECFNQAGFKTCTSNEVPSGFIHGTGHGVGLDIHEQPRVNSSKIKLMEGDVITIEPGLYYPELGGIRIEDLVVVEKNGCSVLGGVQKNLLLINNFFLIDRLFNMRTIKLKLLLIIFYLVNLESVFAQTNKNNSINFKDNSFSSIQMNENQKSEISKIQKEFKNEIDNINASFIEKRKELNYLVESDASNDELKNKIQEITALKSKQLWLIIKNKRTLERILGKEKTNNSYQWQGKDFWTITKNLTKRPLLYP